MDNQTVLNIVLGIITTYLAIKNFIASGKKDVVRESQEMTEMGMLRDMQKDIRTSTADFRALSERVVIIETKVEDAFQRIDELKKGAENGKQ